MSTLLAIQSHEAHYELVKLCWQQNQIPGWPIWGIVPEDSSHPWLPNVFHCSMIGRGGYMQPDVIKRWVKAWEMFLTEEKFSRFDDMCMIESDSLFLRKPEPYPGGLFTRIAGGSVGGASKATRFFHTPWHCCRETAKIIVEEGKKLIAEGELELCSPDLFLGLITDRRPEIKITETNTWSCNGGDFQNRKAEAEKAVRAGAFFVHGIRDQSEIEWLKSLI